MDDLKHCPFCFANAQVARQMSKEPDRWVIECEVCGARCGLSTSSAAARTNWNMRESCPAGRESTPDASGAVAWDLIRASDGAWLDTLREYATVQSYVERGNYEGSAFIVRPLYTHPAPAAPAGEWFGPRSDGGWFVRVGDRWFDAKPQTMLTPEQFANSLSAASPTVEPAESAGGEVTADMIVEALGIHSATIAEMKVNEKHAVAPVLSWSDWVAAADSITAALGRGSGGGSDA